MSGRFKQIEAVGLPGLKGERLPSVWLRRKKMQLEDCCLCGPSPAASRRDECFGAGLNKQAPVPESPWA